MNNKNNRGFSYPLVIQMVAAPLDFEKNQHLLDIVPSEYQHIYSFCVSCGFNIRESFKALDILVLLSKKFGVPIDSVVDNIQIYQLERYVELGKDVVDKMVLTVLKGVS